MKNALKNSVPAIVFFIVMFAIAFLTNNANAQTNQTNEPMIMKYDGVTDPVDFPAIVTKQKLADDEIERKMYRYEMVLPNGIGYPSMEDVKKSFIEEVIEVIVPNKLFVHLIKKDIDTTTANLINPDWDGTNRG